MYVKCYIVYISFILFMYCYTCKAHKRFFFEKYLVSSLFQTEPRLHYQLCKTALGPQTTKAPESPVSFGCNCNLIENMLSDILLQCYKFLEV